jgi:hypothetical protein
VCALQCCESLPTHTQNFSSETHSSIAWYTFRRSGCTRTVVALGWNPPNRKKLQEFHLELFVGLFFLCRLVKEDQDSTRANMPYPWHRVLVNLGRIARIYYYRWSIYSMFGPIFLVVVTGLFLACVCLNVDKTQFAHVQIFLNMQSMVAFTLARNRCASQ